MADDGFNAEWRNWTPSSSASSSSRPRNWRRPPNIPSTTPSLSRFLRQSRRPRRMKAETQTQQSSTVRATMAGERLDAEGEEWDAEFLDQLVQAEELAISHRLAQNQPPRPPPPPPPPREVSYSPPRELSQRTHGTHRTGGVPDSFDYFAPPSTLIGKEPEVSKMKNELNRASKGPSHLENESLDLSKEGNKKEVQLKELHPRIEIKDAEPYLTKNKEMDGLASSSSAPGISTMRQNTNSSNEQLGSRTKSLQTGCRSEKLFALWNSDDQKQGKVLVATLYKTCEADFRALFSYLDSCKNDSNMALSDQQDPSQPMETAKVVHLYSVFTEISNDNSRLEDLLEALVDLCNLKNVFIVQWSLRVVHKILSNPFSMEREFGKRENVTIEYPVSESTKSDTNARGNLANESLCFENLAEMLKQGRIPSAQKLSNVKTPGFGGFFDRSFATSVSQAYQISLFERLCLIATKNDEEEIRREALSVMNLILMRHNAYKERDKFAGELVFQSLPQLLRKEAGFTVQDQAVNVLYLLCNCPKVMDMICSCLKEDGELAGSKDINDENVPTFQVLDEILIGLADCVASYGSATAEEIKLRRNAVVSLAFLGSSGKSGFEILLNHRLPKGTSFLVIILQSLVSDLDLQPLKSATKSDVAQEQNSLIREVLIFLNRLVSHPQYSVVVLQALTATRDMASMTVDIANRLTQKSNFWWQDNKSKKQNKGSEILDLALVFKKRVFTFLGDNIS